MAKQPLTIEEAKTLYNRYENLKGQPYGKDTSSLIEMVVIAPYDELNKHIVMKRFEEGGVYDDALKQYDGALFDIILIAKNIGGDDPYVYKDLDSYLKENPAKEVKGKNGLHASEEST